MGELLDDPNRAANDTQRAGGGKAFERHHVRFQRLGNKPE